MRIKLHSPYHHFPNHEPVKGEDYVDCYNDSFIVSEKPINKNTSIALLIEPRPLQPKVYEYIAKYYNRYKYVFTHDSVLLAELPNAKPIIWGGVYDWADEEKDFTHPISMVASWKEQAPVRIQRKQLALELKGKIDTYGTFDGGARANTRTIYGKYPFSVVIENHIDDIWITEKICNCFACNTVPIYYGARNIGEYFDDDGIIICHSIDEIRTSIDYLLIHAQQEYELRYRAINNNRYLVERYANFETWFYHNYGELLDSMGEMK